MRESNPRFNNSKCGGATFAAPTGHSRCWSKTPPYITSLCRRVPGLVGVTGGFRQASPIYRHRCNPLTAWTRTTITCLIAPAIPPISVILIYGVKVGRLPDAVFKPRSHTPGPAVSGFIPFRCSTKMFVAFKPIACLGQTNLGWLVPPVCSILTVGLGVSSSAPCTGMKMLARPLASLS